MDDLIERLRSEAEISDRPGQFDRLNAIADEFAAALEAAREDAERMAWLATGGCVDGFVDADMLRGLRRLVDAAIDQARGKGGCEEGMGS